MNDMLLDRPYVHYEGEGGHQELPGHVSGEEASWVYLGHGYSFESARELGGTHAHILSGRLGNFSEGLIKHIIDHPSNMGSSGDYSYILVEIMRQEQGVTIITSDVDIINLLVEITEELQVATMGS